MTCSVRSVWAVSVLLAPVAAQDQALERVALRVTGRGPGGAVLVDRGERDRVRIGDEVVLAPSQGGTFRGKVIEVTERSAVVEMRDPGFAPAPGTRGEVLVPRARTAPRPVERQPASRPAQPQPQPQGQPQTQTQPQAPQWRDPDPGFKPDMPLLAQVRSQDPKERTPQIIGRDYMYGAFSYVPGESTNNSFFRVGTDLRFVNTFGEGEVLRVNPELVWRTEQDDKTGFDLVLRRLSYARGGTRFAKDRWEFGRFLQHGLPELGILDGAEWTHRLDGGHRVGASAGFMPEPDDDFEAFHDFQIAGYYQWVNDVTETLVLTGGLQKSFHHSHGDRDLFLGKLRYVPGDGWDFSAVTWVDFYYGHDNLKTSNVEITQAMVSLTRFWQDGDRIDLTYGRLLWPEMLRREFLPVDANQIEDDHLDQLRLSGVGGAFHGLAAVWNDEDRPGGSVEAGTHTTDLGFPGSRADLTAFATRARFAWVLGARATIGRTIDDTRWDLLYELANHHMDGFPSDRDDLFQQRMRGTLGFFLGHGWDLSLHAEGNHFDSDFAASVGIAIQRSY
jgi:hypothetical protein